MSAEIERLLMQGTGAAHTANTKGIYQWKEGSRWRKEIKKVCEKASSAKEVLVKCGVRKKTPNSYEESLIYALPLGRYALAQALSERDLLARGLRGGMLK